MRLFQDFTRDGVGRADLRAFGAANAVGGDFEFGQFGTLPCRTIPLQVRLKLLPEFVQCAKDHIRRGTSERAKRTLLDLAGQCFNPVKNVRRFGSALREGFDPFAKLQHPLAAQDALAARFIAQELEEVERKIDQTIPFVDHDQSARSHHRATLSERFVVNRQIEIPFGDASARRSANHDGLNRVTLFRAAAEGFDYFPNRNADRHLNEPALFDLPRQGERLRPMRLFRADRGEGRAVIRQNDRDAGECLDIVHQRGQTVQSVFHREWRSLSRNAPAPFDRLQQRGLLAAHKGTRATEEKNLESRREDAEQAVFA